jgi:hypothetical protein
VPIYNNSVSGLGYNINRFRRFSDTLMYAAGTTIYKYNLNITGVQDLNGQSDDFTVYPNPANNGNNMVIRSKFYPDKLSVEVYDVMGRIVAKETLPGKTNEHKLSVKLKAGNYVIKILTRDNVIYVREVIVK